MRKLAAFTIAMLTAAALLMVGAAAAAPSQQQQPVLNVLAGQGDQTVVAEQFFGIRP